MNSKSTSNDPRPTPNRSTIAQFAIASTLTSHLISFHACNAHLACFGAMTTEEFRATILLRQGGDETPMSSRRTLLTQQQFYLADQQITSRQLSQSPWQ